MQTPAIKPLMLHPSYRLGIMKHQPFIECRRCGMRSYHPGDRENLYCACCHLFHQHDAALQSRMEDAEIVAAAPEGASNPPMVERICEECGVAFELLARRAKEPGRGKFCSKKCSGKNTFRRMGTRNGIVDDYKKSAIRSVLSHKESFGG